MPINIDDTTTQIIGAATLLGALEKFFKPVRRARTAMLNYLKERKENSLTSKVTKLADSVNELKDKVDKIVYQTQHNDGGSMRDDISYVRKEVELVSHSLKASMEMMDEGLFRCDSSGDIYLVNGPFANLLGVTREQLVAREWTRWFKDEEIVGRILRSMEQGISFDSATELVDIDGRPKSVRVKVVKFMGDDFEGRVIPI